MNDQPTDDRLKELYDRGITGLDLSPGDSLCYWAHGEILQLRTEVERLKREIKTDSWTQEMQEALEAIPSRFVENDYWVNGIKRMAAEVEQLAEHAAKAERGSRESAKKTRAAEAELAKVREAAIDLLMEETKNKYQTGSVDSRRAMFRAALLHVASVAKEENK